MTTEEFVIELIHWYGPIAIPFLIVIAGGGYFFARNWVSIVELIREARKPAPHTPSAHETLKATLAYRKSITHHSAIHLDPCRREMLSDLMEIRYRVFIEALDNLDQYNLGGIGPSKLHRVLLSAVTDAVNNAEERSREAGIPEEAVHLFCAPTYMYVQSFMTVVKAVCGDYGFRSNQERMRLLYYVLSEFVDEGSREAEEAFAGAAERFTGVKYKGHVCT